MYMCKIAKTVGAAKEHVHALARVSAVNLITQLRLASLCELEVEHWFEVSPVAALMEEPCHKISFTTHAASKARQSR